MRRSLHGCHPSIEQRKQRKEMASRYVLHEVCRGQYRFTLTSHKGQVLLTSVLFMDKESALHEILVTRRLAHNSRNFVFLNAEGGGCYFTVITRKGQTLAYSAIYPDAEGRQIAINLVKGNTRGARLEDLTQAPAYQQESPAPLVWFAAAQVWNQESLPIPVSALEETEKPSQEP